MRGFGIDSELPFKLLTTFISAILKQSGVKVKLSETYYDVFHNEKRNAKNSN